MSLWRGQLSTIPTAPLTGVCIALVLAALPLLDKIAPWAAAILAAAILLRIFVNRQRLRLPAVPLKIALLAIGIGGVAYSYGSLVGVEPGLGILLILLALKLLETNTVRDFQVLVLLGWFLCLCGLFFSQDLTMWLYVSANGLLLAASLIHFHRAPERGGFAPALGLALKLVMQASPIVVLLFLFFPRTQGNFLFQFNRPPVAVTGMSDLLSPGSFTKLTQNDSLAFRADFPDGNVPPLSQLYWRGAVLWRGDGLTWARGSAGLQREALSGQLAGAAIRQRIFLKPHGGRWLFALDRPAALDRPSKDLRDARIEAGGFLQSQRPVVAPLTYEVVSRPDNRESTLPREQRAEALRKPELISPRVQALVDSWRAFGANDREVVETALRYFRKEKFVYSLAPDTYGVDPLSEFLFERRSGFCEHYAAAFASLMRVAGIPSRVIVGYHGGQFGLGNYLIVRQLDAHAWAEVWLKGQGWQRIDPTNIIAPGRITSGSESFLDSQALAAGAAAGETSAGAGLRDLLREAGLVWDNVKYQWDLRVLNFDEDAQRTLLSFVGLADLTPPLIVLWLILGVLLFCGLLGLWIGRSRPDRIEPLVREYHAFCRLLAAAGSPREPWEGPLQFSERAAGEFPQQAAAIREAAALYIAARYAQQPVAISKFKDAVRAIPRPAKLPARAASP